LNKKYKLDNQKISKEFTQDFLEEYKEKGGSGGGAPIVEHNKTRVV